jgi:P27 family predicted phage terminase small subunit
MPRAKVDTKLTGRDRSRDVDAFKLEPLSELPKPNIRLDTYAEKFYYQIGSSLIDAKQLRIVDVPSLENAAFFYSACQRCMDAMSDTDGLIQLSQNGFKQASPYVSVHEKYAKLLQQFADRFGLNLTGATKVPKAKSDRNSLNDMLK